MDEVARGDAAVAEEVLEGARRPEWFERRWFRELPPVPVNA